MFNSLRIYCHGSQANITMEMMILHSKNTGFCTVGIGAACLVDLGLGVNYISAEVGGYKCGHRGNSFVRYHNTGHKSV